MPKHKTRKMTAAVCAFALATCMAVSPAEKAVSANESSNDIRININDQPVVFTDQYPVNIDGRIYVPLRVIGEDLGAKVDWVESTRQVLINWKKENTPSLITPSPSGEVQIIIDGRLLNIPAGYGQPYIIKSSGRTMIPLRAVGEALSCQIEWNNLNGLAVNITKPLSVDIIAPVEEPRPVESPEPVKPPIDPADSQLLKDLADYRTNLKLMDGSVINSAILSTKEPGNYTAEQLSIFRTYREQLSKYGSTLLLPNGQTTNAADISIMGNSYLTADQLRSWIAAETPRLKDKAAANGLQFNEIPDLADLYIKIGAEYGIRGDLAFCQAAKETGYWQYTGDVQPWQNNYCGLWATGSPFGGMDTLKKAELDSLNRCDPNQIRLEKGIHGAIFATPEAGVEAHIQHLYAYATKSPLPAGKVLVDPRFVLVNKGIAPTWLGLNARWAVPGTTYGQSIIYDYWCKAAR